jgi:hypothetical protein
MQYQTQYRSGMIITPSAASIGGGAPARGRGWEGPAAGGLPSCGAFSPVSLSVSNALRNTDASR